MPDPISLGALKHSLSLYNRSKQKDERIEFDELIQDDRVLQTHQQLLKDAAMRTLDLNNAANDAERENWEKQNYMHRQAWEVLFTWCYIYCVKYLNYQYRFRENKTHRHQDAIRVGAAKGITEKLENLRDEINAYFALPEDERDERFQVPQEIRIEDPADVQPGDKEMVEKRGKNKGKTYWLRKIADGKSYSVKAAVRYLAWLRTKDQLRINDPNLEFIPQQEAERLKAEAQRTDTPSPVIEIITGRNSDGTPKVKYAVQRILPISVRVNSETGEEYLTGEDDKAAYETIVSGIQNMIDSHAIRSALKELYEELYQRGQLNEFQSEFFQRILLTEGKPIPQAQLEREWQAAGRDFGYKTIGNFYNNAILKKILQTIEEDPERWKTFYEMSLRGAASKTTSGKADQQ